jgi:hypothetical protein
MSPLYVAETVYAPTTGEVMVQLLAAVVVALDPLPLKVEGVHDGFEPDGATMTQLTLPLGVTPALPFTVAVTVKVVPTVADEGGLTVSVGTNC